MSDVSKRPYSEAQGTSVPKKSKSSGLQEQKSTNPLNKDGISECFQKFTTSLYVSLAPCHVNNPINGIKSQHLDPLIMNYFPKARGVVLAYSNIKIGEDNQSVDSQDSPITVGRISESSPFVFLWITVDFLIWSPQVGDVIEGNSYMQTASHIGLLIHDTFNASIKKFNIPQNWSFIPNQEDEYTEEAAEVENLVDGVADKEGSSAVAEGNKFKSFGYWVDENEVKIEGKLKFTIKSIHSTGKVVSVEGTLLKPGSERDAQPIFRERRSSVQQQASSAPSNKHMKFDDVAEETEPVPSYEREQTGDDDDEDGEVLNNSDSDEESD
ncbi:DNA-directed RNA polymerase I subunit Rpa43p [[Candida] railenensis]|uniref:DNA-directed RNA polymerase subunit n=1 Tax=[Candida] railenensis TaxID=45579 RepID=A0A9P0QLK4_9ASCO|nr:DNA-directed RNA polymerase I subunit Rpa43p [[Candida] railenensis]